MGKVKYMFITALVVFNLVVGSFVWRLFSILLIVILGMWDRPSKREFRKLNTGYGNKVKNKIRWK